MVKIYFEIGYFEINSKLVTVAYFEITCYRVRVCCEKEEDEREVSPHAKPTWWYRNARPQAEKR